MTLPPRLEPTCSINSARDERSIFIWERLAGVSKPPSAAEREALLGAGDGKAHLEGQRELRRVGRGARASRPGSGSPARESCPRSRRNPMPGGRARRRGPREGQRGAARSYQGTHRRRRPARSSTKRGIGESGRFRPTSQRLGSEADCIDLEPKRRRVRHLLRRAAGNRPSEASITYLIGRAWLTTSSVSSGRASNADSARAKRSAASVRLSPPPGHGASGSFFHAHSRYAASDPPSNAPKPISSSSGSTRRETRRPASARSSVCCVRRSRELKPTSIAEGTRSDPSSRASSLPLSESPPPGGVELTTAPALDSACA